MQPHTTHDGTPNVQSPLAAEFPKRISRSVGGSDVWLLRRELQRTYGLSNDITWELQAVPTVGISGYRRLVYPLDQHVAAATGHMATPCLLPSQATELHTVSLGFLFTCCSFPDSACPETPLRLWQSAKNDGVARHLSSFASFVHLVLVVAARHCVSLALLLCCAVAAGLA